MNARRRLDRRTHRGDSGAMPGHARHVAPLGPAPVAVHDDGDVSGEPRRIQMPVNFRFLAVEPREVLCRCKVVTDMRLPQEGRGGNDTDGVDGYDVARALLARDNAGAQMSAEGNYAGRTEMFWTIA